MRQHAYIFWYISRYFIAAKDWTGLGWITTPGTLVIIENDCTDSELGALVLDAISKSRWMVPKPDPMPGSNLEIIELSGAKSENAFYRKAYHVSASREHESSDILLTPWRNKSKGAYLPLVEKRITVSGSGLGSGVRAAFDRCL